MEFGRVPRVNRFLVPEAATVPAVPAPTVSRRLPKPKPLPVPVPEEVPPPLPAPPLLYTDIVPQALPSQPFEHLYSFPHVRAVYFALDATDTVLYIGSSKNMHQRWAATHEKARALREAGCVRMTWYEVLEGEMLGIERALIRKFQPPLNDRSNTKDELLSVWVPASVYEQTLV